MKSKDDLINFQSRSFQETVLNCKVCGGEDPSCDCFQRYRLQKELFEGCVPRSFWGIKEKQIKFNLDEFKKVVVVFCKNLKRAIDGGYGLAFLGRANTGKTTFICYILKRIAEKRGLNVYYTTIDQLNDDITTGFNINGYRRKLDYYLGSDILAIDELDSLLTYKNKGSFLKNEVSAVLKQRSAKGKPTLMAGQLLIEQFDSLFEGSTASFISRKFKSILLFEDESSEVLEEKKSRDMGYGI